MFDGKMTEEKATFVKRYRENFASKTFEFGEYDPKAPLAEDDDYEEGFEANQSGFAGDIAKDGSYIEWFFG